MKNESMTDKWFDARMTGPFAGMFSTPRTQGRKVPRTKGPAKRCLSTQYNMRGLPIGDGTSVYSGHARPRCAAPRFRNGRVGSHGT
ncbi:conserved hypothetical protein [Pseudoclavibacter sp. 8L]|nr:conserved hypothetical protein [Pseudoclavibacter sp. 8L]